MTTEREKPMIAFVWRKKHISSSIVDLARRTSTRAIFDVTSVDLDTVCRALLSADASPEVVDLKVSHSSLMDPGLEDFLHETGINTLWVELHPVLLERDFPVYLDRISSLSAKTRVIPVAGSPDVVTRIVREGAGDGRIALKGNEASGFVSPETLLTLWGGVRTLAKQEGHTPRVSVWGGLATPEAAAAFLAVGADTVVLESLHWLTDAVALDERLSSRIAALRPDHTDLIGLNLGVPCRLYNKGNSRAVKELKQFSGSLCGEEIRDEQRRFFAQRIQREEVEPLESSLNREELIPLGVEAAFAHGFVRRFGSQAEVALDRFVKTVAGLCNRSGDRLKDFADSPVATAMGTRYPFVQGAMSWITDVPQFARAVADAGGLPTVALGLMDGATLKEKLGTLPGIMEDRPYAVNIITLPENPFRDVQLAWIGETRPRFAVIAAGEPSHATELLARGIEVIYIAPNEDLLKLAFEAGIRYVICEGNEAGGHVGLHSMVTMAQTVLELKDRAPELFRGKTVILAGGVCNRETAFIATMLGADAVQMGTVYLATREIVETGALTSLYQRMIVESEIGATTVTGEGTGLRVRSLRTPMIEAVCSLERDFMAGSEQEGPFRRKIEALSAGSLFIAARGLDKPGGERLDEARCLEQGQFMSGACAGSIREVLSLEEMHKELADGPLAAGLPVTQIAREAAVEGPSRWIRTPVARPSAPERIAVTAMSQVNSLGNSPEEVWANCVALKSGIVPIPPSRWKHEIFFHPRPRMPEKTYCSVGAFQNIEISRKELGIPPQDFRTMTSATRITMWLAHKAIEESGILSSDIPKERIAVLISQNSGEAAATLQDVIIRGASSTIVSAVKQVVPLTPETEQAVEEAVKAGRLAVDDTTLLGRLNCSAGGFICNKYGFMGPSFSVSAACATALVALYSALQMIRNGVIDAAVVGGAEELLTPIHFLEFSALGALAGLSGVERPASQSSRPFDAARDGMVLGEGGAMIVIERESVARRRKARTHAYVTSMGASNNNLGMVESSRISQEIAIRASFKDIPYGPEGVDLVECHATSTVQGDVEEVRALKEFYSPEKPVVLTSFKSQIGHTLGASGINSLVRGIMAMKSGLFPPTINYENPDPEMGLEGSGLTIHREPAPWGLRNGKPRRLQVNAFGFGGSNYVVQLEQAMDAGNTVVSRPAARRETAPERSEIPPLPDGIFVFSTEIGSKPYRAAVLAETETEALGIIERQEPLGESCFLNTKRLKALARKAVHLGALDVETAPLAFVFPGQGSHYAGMGHELYKTFPVIREWMERAAAVADFDLLRLLFFDQEEDLQKTRWQQPALFTMEYSLVQYLLTLGVRPEALAGHSLGELTALCLAGVYSFEDGFRIVNKRALCMDKACTLNPDPGIMMATDAPMEVIQEMLAEREHIYITNLNSPRQIVIGGDTEAVRAMGAEIKARGHRRTELRVSMAFHSPIMRCIHDELEEFIAGVQFHAPQIPVISNTTMRPFPDDPVEIKRTVMAHLESPVHWMENVRTLWTELGVRLFVEVGPREILSNLIHDTIEEAECIQTCLPSAEVMVYKTAVAQLLVRGYLQCSFQSSPVVFPGAGKRLELPAADRPSMPRPLVSAAPTANGLEAIVHREMGAFILDSFGRYLKPAILHAARKEYDPGLTEEGLDLVLQRMFRMTAVPAAAPPISVERVIALPVAVASQDAILEPAQAAPPVVQADAVDMTEQVILIIMEATGYEREEVEPDMDLREDLSIRSSRLPVIMDSLEGHFHIKIELEEFMDVRTIRDIADRISDVLARSDHSAGASLAVGTAGADEAEAPASELKQPIKRMIFREVPIDAGPVQPVELSPMDAVVVFSSVGGTGLRKGIGTVIRRDYGTEIVPGAFLAPEARDGEIAVDLRTDEGVAAATERIRELEALAGLVFIVDDGLAAGVQSMEDVTALLRGFFSLLKVLMEAPARKFALLIEKTDQHDGPGRLLAEGVLGTFLSAALEYSSLQFRTVRIVDETDLRVAVRRALDRSIKPIELLVRGEECFTSEGCVSPAHVAPSEHLTLSPDDVVVFSGGGYGVTSFLARSLIPYGCKVALLGRTVLDPDVDFGKLLVARSEAKDSVAALVAATKPTLSAAEQEREIARLSAALEIVQTLEDLRAGGIEAEYFACDVTDSDRTASVVDQIAARFGRIDGIVHGAGVLRDGFMRYMEPEDFSAVVDVKVLGAWNLLDAARTKGLRFMACLSSAAAIQGNPGQANYAAGNRLMSGLMAEMAHKEPGVQFKALFLPPVEGTGMAEDPEIRALMARLKAGYVHLDELSALFCRELFAVTDRDVWVLFMRSLPEIQTARLDPTEPPARSGTITCEGLSVGKEDFPMIDAITRIDLTRGILEASRSFSRETDLWIADHKPFKFLKNPLVSSIMAIETFAEAARLLHPHLRVKAVRDARFLDIVDCPPLISRHSEVSCRRTKSEVSGEVVCDLTLSTREISPSGRTLDRMQANYTAQVVLGDGTQAPLTEPDGFPVKPQDLLSRPMEHTEVLEKYDRHSDMQGRYRVIERLDGAGEGAIRGSIVYRQGEDFADLSRASYQYSPYLLEAFLQMVNFYLLMRNPLEERTIIPARIGEVTFGRSCEDQERIIIEGRMKRQDENGVTWDARGMDEKGRVIMVARELVLRWFS